MVEIEERSGNESMLNYTLITNGLDKLQGGQYVATFVHDMVTKVKAAIRVLTVGIKVRVVTSFLHVH